jgi:cell division protein FtsI (penicillin-binding protein 3)
LLKFEKIIRYLYMSEEIKNQAIKQRTKNITLLFGGLAILMGIFLVAILKTIISDRKVPSQYATIHDRSLRGDIISKDDYTLSYSQKTYSATVNGSSIKPEKRELFIKLFSIYTDINPKDIKAKLKDKKGHYKKGTIFLSKTLTQKQAMQLKSLAYKLRRLHIFRSIKVRGIEVLYGLDIIENGESRIYPLADNLSPVIGYTAKEIEDGYMRPIGKKGLEKAYEEHLRSKKDGYFKGKRDVSGRIIHDKNSIQKLRVDGLSLHLNIPLSVQRRVELMLDSMKSKLNAQEIIAGVMDSHTGKVLALASSNRFNPSHITKKDIEALNPKFAEYLYEPGSVIKPLTLAIALNHNVVTPHSWFNTGYYKFQIGKHRFITDDDYFKSQTASDIIVHSSNIGISQISWRLTGKEFRDGLIAFGLSKPSGIDLSRDLKGRIKPLHLLDNQMHRANSSYGYGMMVSFAQLFKAYSAFNNDGVAVTPRIVDYLIDKKGNHYTLEPKVPNLQAISKKAANQIHKILLRVVQDKKGTGRAARYPGLEIGGKTGTAHTVKNGHYVKEYHSSFYGFANDDYGNRYTIGVLVIKAKKWHKYFASQSAVPTFRNIVQILVEEGYLKPNEVAQENSEQKNIYEIEKPTTQQPTIPQTTISTPKPSTKPTPKPKHTPKPSKPKTINTKPKVNSNNIFDIINTKPTNNKPTIKPKPTPQVKPKSAPKPKKPPVNYEDLF